MQCTTQLLPIQAIAIECAMQLRSLTSLIVAGFINPPAYSATLLPSRLG